MMKTFLSMETNPKSWRGKWLGRLVFLYFFYHENFLSTINLEVQRITLGSGIILTTRVTYWRLNIPTSQPHYLLFNLFIIGVKTILQTGLEYQLTQGLLLVWSGKLLDTLETGGSALEQYLAMRNSRGQNVKIGKFG